VSQTVVLLQAVATYAAILSAACFAVPLFRSVQKSHSRDILSLVETDDERVAKLFKRAHPKLDADLKTKGKGNRRYNSGGAVLLFVSVAAYTAAFFVG